MRFSARRQAKPMRKGPALLRRTPKTGLGNEEDAHMTHMTHEERDLTMDPVG